MVKVKLVEPPRGMLAAPKALMIAGGATTVIVALDVFPVPPSVDVTCTLLLITLAIVPVTFTVMVHEVLEARVPLARLTVPDPATAVAVPPHPVLTSPFGVATTRPTGRLSVNAIPVSAMVLAAGLVMVKFNLLEPFNAILSAPNTLAMFAGESPVTLASACVPPPQL